MTDTFSHWECPDHTAKGSMPCCNKAELVQDDWNSRKTEPPQSLIPTPEQAGLLHLLLTQGGWKHHQLEIEEWDDLESKLRAAMSRLDSEGAK